MMTDTQLRTAFMQLCGTGGPDYAANLARSCEELLNGRHYRIYGSVVGIAAKTSNQGCYQVTETLCSCPQFQHRGNCYHLAMREVILTVEKLKNTPHVAGIVKDADLPPGINLSDVLQLAADLEHEEGLTADEAYLQAIDTLLYQQEDAPPTLIVVPTGWGTVLRRGQHFIVLTAQETEVLRQALNRGAEV